jgi:hypothetical protein
MSLNMFVMHESFETPFQRRKSFFLELRSLKTKRNQKYSEELKSKISLKLYIDR